MTDRIRRLFGIPPRERDMVMSLRDARCEALERGRESIHNRQMFERVLHSGEVDYDELNRAMFGRTGWPREEGQ